MAPLVWHPGEHRHIFMFVLQLNCFCLEVLLFGMWYRSIERLEGKEKKKDEFLVKHMRMLN